jgi:cytoskeletal protein RodZ
MTVGTRLRSAREQAGMSVADVAATTRLRASIIVAMEGDDFSLCGGAVYARAQLRMMAPIIGLDPDEIAQYFDAQSPEIDY